MAPYLCVRPLPFRIPCSSEVTISFTSFSSHVPPSCSSSIPFTSKVGISFIYFHFFLSILFFPSLSSSMSVSHRFRGRRSVRSDGQDEGGQACVLDEPRPRPYAMLVRSAGQKSPPPLRYKRHSLTQT